MSIVANSYITNHSFRHSKIVPLLVTGFTGTLRYWWDKHLTTESKNLIIHAVKLNEEGLPIFDEQVGQGIEDGVNTLFYTIIDHFIGTPSNTTARIHDQLSNLHCPKLSDFRWLQDNPPPWSSVHTEIVKQIKVHVKTLPSLGIPSVDSFKIVETDASDIGYGCTMAPKKDKHKESANQPKSSQSLRILPPSMSQTKPESPKQLVPFPGCSPISVASPLTIANRFSSLGSTVGQIRPSYQSSLVSSYDPFSVGPSVASFKKTSPYLPKSNFHLFVIESIYDVHSDPVAIAKHYFPPGFHYMPPSRYKSLKYYRDILLETQSIEIKPIRDRDRPKVILYHSIYIHRILSQESFSSHPYKLKTLQSKLQYNYSDYIEAWYSIFLHQSEDFSHSWFISILTINSNVPFLTLVSPLVGKTWPS
ncbi:unnamed protein product [Prunus brigantina]